MIKVEKALRLVLAGVKILPGEGVSLPGGWNRVLANDVYASADVPAFNNSAMDGYALRSADTIAVSVDAPKMLEVAGVIKAGDSPKKISLPAHQAIKIMTGAPMPVGADSVVMVEDTAQGATPQGRNVASKGKKYVKIFKEVVSGENVRRAGEDIKKGQLVLKKGALVQAAHLGILAALGAARPGVTRKPVVAVLTTGDELVDAGEKLRDGCIHNSNAYSLYGQVLEAGGEPVFLGIAKDSKADLSRKIKRGTGKADILVISGGISAGDYDFVKDCLKESGAQMKFWKVAMRPGKPLSFGRLGKTAIFGLPGNPVSSMISFELFVRPLILKMLGRQDNRKEVEATAEEDLFKKSGLSYFLRARTRWDKDRYRTTTTGPQGSGILRSMVLANSLIVLPPNQEKILKGNRVRVRWLDNRY